MNCFLDWYDLIAFAGRHLLRAGRLLHEGRSGDHKATSARAGKGADEFGLSGKVDPNTFKAILEGKAPDGPQFGLPEKDGIVTHRPGRDATFSAPKSVSLVALLGDDRAVVAAARSTAPRGSSFAPAIASAGPGTIRGSASSTAAPPRCSSSKTAASRPVSKTGESSISGDPIRSFAISTTPRRLPYTPSGAGTVGNVIAAMEGNHPHLTTQ